jgi:hypothetical protein
MGKKEEQKTKTVHVQSLKGKKDRRKGIWQTECLNLFKGHANYGGRRTRWMSIAHLRTEVHVQVTPFLRISQTPSSPDVEGTPYHGLPVALLPPMQSAQWSSWR